MTMQDRTARTRDNAQAHEISETNADNRFERGPYAAYTGSPDTHIGATQPIAVRKGLFDGISVAQVLAASAAAATSMLLASKIGIAGSVIGAAVSSMVTVICSQLYRNALDASAQKLKARQVLSGTVHTAPSDDATQGRVRAEGETRVYTARIAPTKLQARAAAERIASKRKVAFVSVLIAAIAVVACAGIIMLGTAGQGLGTKAQPLFGAADASSDKDLGPADELASTNAAQDPAGDSSPAPNGGAVGAPSESQGATGGDPALGTGDNGTGGEGSGALDENAPGTNEGQSTTSPDGGGTPNAEGNNAAAAAGTPIGKAVLGEFK